VGNWMEKKTNGWEVVGDELDGPALADHCSCFCILVLVQVL
jgi:hypothetical protein